MQKKLSTVLTGGAISLLLFSVVSTAVATGGTLGYNQVNVSIFGEQKISADKSIVTPNATTIPTTMTYTDETGKDTTYISMRKMAELLGTDVSWDGATNTVDFDFRWDSEVIIEVGEPNATPSYEQMATAPIIGLQAGPFTEIEPRKDKGRPIIQLDNADFRSKTGFINQYFSIDPQRGNYIEIEVTNHGAPLGFRVAQPIMLSSNASVNSFSPVRLNEGDTMTRAFIMGETDVEMDRFLKLTIVAFGGLDHETDITVNVTQYS